MPVTDADSSGGRTFLLRENIVRFYGWNMTYVSITPLRSYYQRYPLSRINGESVVPYTVKEGTKYVPLFYFEGETEHLKLKSEVVDGWVGIIVAALPRDVEPKPCDASQLVMLIYHLMLVISAIQSNYSYAANISSSLHPLNNHFLRWDLAYLKFCCKVQGIRNELFANDVCKVKRETLYLIFVVLVNMIIFT